MGLWCVPEDSDQAMNTSEAALSTHSRSGPTPGPVVCVRRLTQVKIFYRLRLQNLFPGVILPTVLRVRARGYIVLSMSKGSEHGFIYLV